MPWNILVLLSARATIAGFVRHILSRLFMVLFSAAACTLPVRYLLLFFAPVAPRRSAFLVDIPAYRAPHSRGRRTCDAIRAPRALPLRERWRGFCAYWRITRPMPARAPRRAVAPAGTTPLQHSAFKRAIFLLYLCLPARDWFSHFTVAGVTLPFCWRWRRDVTVVAFCARRWDRCARRGDYGAYGWRRKISTTLRCHSPPPLSLLPLSLQKSFRCVRAAA